MRKLGLAAAAAAAILTLGLARGGDPARAATPTATASRATYLALAQQGIGSQSSRWRTATDGWYCETLGCRGAYPLLTIWGMVRMFEAVDAVALAAPTAAHRAAVNRLAARAVGLYWNRYLNGFDPYPGDDYPAAHAWFDDNGWLGLAFVDAYRATGRRQWLAAAQRALDFIAANGWDGANGMWWNTQHTQHSGEALAADSLLASMLYQLDGNRADLAHARLWIGWADAHDIGFRGLYDSMGKGDTVIDYVEAPLIYAQQLVCKATGVTAYCTHAAAQSQTLTVIYGYRYDLAPMYDSIFFQWMLAYDRASGDDHWLAIAQENAAAAMHNAADAQGVWLHAWWGGRIRDPKTAPGMYRTMAGTTSLYAWLAYYTPGAAA